MNQISETSTSQRFYPERIGDREWELKEELLNVHEDVVLWDSNPRLLAVPTLSDAFGSEAELEARLEQTNGYDGLKRSIKDIGQMEPIYVWKPRDAEKYVVIEGATRTCILRQLDRRHTTGNLEQKFRYVRARILPPEFDEKYRMILLARIHVRGTGVRQWGRYIQAKHIYEAVVATNGGPPMMNVTEMAQYMNKSTSWVQRLRDAYEFSKRFVEHVDTDEAPAQAAKFFSVLEEISKAKTIGSQLRDYDNPALDNLRSEVFDMVQNDVFKEYRDARFLKDFYDDPDKWAQLKSGEPNVANKLALEIKTNASSPKSKIASVPQMVQRSLDRGEIEFDEDDIEALQRAIHQISGQVHAGVRPFRVELRKLTQTLTEASMADVRALHPNEIEDFEAALSYFRDLVTRHADV